MSLQPPGPLARRPKRHRNGEEAQSHAGDEDNHNKKRKVDQQEAGETHKLFACPYYKRCPTRWDKPPCRSREGWKNVARLKQHLQETHFKHICERCRALFETEAELKSHGVAQEGCTPQEETDYIRGFGASIQDKLRSRKMGRGKSQFDYWQMVYTTLFPDASDADVPSPYYTPFNVHDWYHQCRDHRVQDACLRVRLNNITASGSSVDVIVENILGAIDDSDMSLIRLLEKEGAAKKGKLSVRSETTQGTHSTLFGGDIDEHNGNNDGQIAMHDRPLGPADTLRMEETHVDAFGLQMVGTSTALVMGHPPQIYPSHDFSAMYDFDPRELPFDYPHVVDNNSHDRHNDFHAQPANFDLTVTSQGRSTDTNNLQLHYPPTSPNGSFLPLLQDDNCHHPVSGSLMNPSPNRALGIVPRQESMAEVNQAISQYKAAFKDGDHNP